MRTLAALGRKRFRACEGCARSQYLLACSRDAGEIGAVRKQQPSCGVIPAREFALFLQSQSGFACGDLQTYGIAAALPVFRAQGFGHFVNTASTAAHRIVPNMAVYAGTKIAVRAISEGLRQEAGDKIIVRSTAQG
jgi:hypothetical protein